MTGTAARQLLHTCTRQRACSAKSLACCQFVVASGERGGLDVHAAPASSCAAAAAAGGLTWPWRDCVRTADRGRRSCLMRMP
ncbi:hypothetical protein EON67_03190 [archaeon]|nr:MAG: hypothetical protein EON67_03190 [archaeon]